MFQGQTVPLVKKSLICSLIRVVFPNITDYIFDEVATVSLIRLKNIDRVVKIGKTLLKATRIIEINKNCFDDAWDIFCAQKNTHLSFTDCTTISAMQQNNIEKLATFDKDFTKINEIRVIDS